MLRVVRIGLAMTLLAAVGAQAELKIAVLNLQQAIIQSEEAIASIETIREELKQDEDDLMAMGEEIQGLQDKIVKDGEVMSDSEKRSITKDIEDMQIDYQFNVQKLQKELQDRQQDLLRDMQPKLNAVLKDLIDIEGYDAVLDRQSFIYVNPKHDITKKVTEKLNDKQ